MKSNKIVQYIIFISLGVMLFILPFPRGLFFEKEILPVQILCFGIFLVWILYKNMNKQKIEIRSYMGIAVLTLFLSYILPIILGQAANRYDALQYVIRYGAYMIIFLMMAEFTSSTKVLSLWLHILGVSGIAAALLGIDAAGSGKLNNLFGFFGGLDQWGRVNGVLQYPNSYAAYLGVVFFICIGLALITPKQILKSVYSGLTILLLAAMILTVSRGAIAMVPILFLVLLVILPGKQKRLEAILLTVAPVGVTLFSIRRLQSLLHTVQNLLKEQHSTQNEMMQVWILLAGAVAVTAVATFVLLLLLKALNTVPDGWYTVGFIGILLVGAGAVFILWKTGIYTRILPEFLLQRFATMGTVEEATSGRTNFYRDGLKLLKDHWILGAGGGAWNALYRMYQSYSYGSSEAHSLPLQVWIETGIVGIGSLIVLFATTIRTYFKSRNSAYNTEQAVLLTALWMLLIHSLIDFNFSYFSLPIIAFTLIGCMEGLSDQKDCKVRIPSWEGIIVGSIFLIMPICFMTSRAHAVQATAIMRSEGTTAESTTKALAEMEKAVGVNGWNVHYYVQEKVTESELQMDLDRLYEYALAQGAKQDIKNRHKDVLTKALRLNPTNPIINVKMGAFLIKHQNFEEGIQCVEKALRYNPMGEARYQEVAQANLLIGKFYIQQNNIEQAKKLLTRVIQLEQDIEMVNQRALKPVPMTPQTTAYIEEAKELLQQIP